MAAYRGCLQDAGIELGPDWDAVTAAAQAAFIVARGHMIARAALHDQLSQRWPGLVIPEYPALAQPGSAALPLPDWWPPKG